MFEKFKRNSAAARLLEEQLYEQVVVELANGQMRNGLWAKSLANSNGMEEKAKALYIKYRIQSIKDEVELSAAIVEEAENQRREAEYQRRNAPAIERQKRINTAEALLRSKGYRLKTKGSGWVVKEPLGGQQPINSLEELEQYTRSR